MGGKKVFLKVPWGSHYFMSKFGVTFVSEAARWSGLYRGFGTPNGRRGWRMRSSMIKNGIPWGSLLLLLH